MHPMPIKNITNCANCAEREQLYSASFRNQSRDAHKVAELLICPKQFHLYSKTIFSVVSVVVLIVV